MSERPLKELLEDLRDAYRERHVADAANEMARRLRKLDEVVNEAARQTSDHSYGPTLHHNLVRRILDGGD